MTQRPRNESLDILTWGDNSGDPEGGDVLFGDHDEFGDAPGTPAEFKERGFMFMTIDDATSEEGNAVSSSEQQGKYKNKTQRRKQQKKGSDHVSKRRGKTLTLTNPKIKARVVEARKKRAKRHSKQAKVRIKQWLKVEASIELQMKKADRENILAKAAEERNARFRKAKLKRDAEAAARETREREAEVAKLKQAQAIQKQGREFMARQKKLRAKERAEARENREREQREMAKKKMDDDRTMREYRARMRESNARRRVKERTADRAPLPDSYSDSMDEYGHDPLFRRDILSKYIGVTGFD